MKILHRGPARKAEGTKILSVTPITEADLEQLRKPAARMGLASIRDSHHNVARHLAAGLNLTEVADVTGYSVQRIGTLRQDPAMEELIAHYRGLVTDGWRGEVDSHQNLAMSNMRKAERMIADKLDEADMNGDTLPVRELVAISSDRMDRFGYSKKTANLNVNIDFAARLESAIARTAAMKKVAAE